MLQQVVQEKETLGQNKENKRKDNIYVCSKNNKRWSKSNNDPEIGTVKILPF